MANLIDPQKLLECNVIDCRPPAPAPTAPPVPKQAQTIDYMAKDYDSLLRAMLDLIPSRVPGWKDRTEADLGMALLELFAYFGDQFSYYQDRVGNEAFLRTATQYDSVRRLLRLIDYQLDPGSAAQVILAMETTTATFLPVGFQVRSQGAAQRAPVVFETGEGKVLHPALNEILLHQDAPSNASKTQAVLNGELDAFLSAGSWILLESPTQREWGQLAVAPAVDTVNHTTAVTFIDPLTSTYPAATSKVRGNSVPASHGQTYTATAKGTGLPNQTLPLEFAPLTFTTDSQGEGRSSLQVSVNDVPWQQVEDFIDSGPADSQYQLAQDSEGFLTVIFGDGKQGQMPPAASSIQVRYRVGIGEAGLVAADTLTAYFDPDGRIRKVTNALPSFGAREPQALAEAKLLGPNQIRRQNRTVVPQDYEDALLKGVAVGNKLVKPLHAKARYHFTGSWTTAVVSVDMPDRQPLARTPAVRSAFLAALAARKLAGYEVRVEDARYAPLHIALLVHVKPDFFARQVRQQIEKLLGAKKLPDGTLGFFAAGRFAFGEDVHLSDLYSVVMIVEGVESLSVTRFKRLGNRYPDRRREGSIAVDSLEIVRCDTDPANPQNGVLYVRTCGGKEG